MGRQNNQKAKDKMAVVHPYIPVITQNMNDLKSPIKRHRVDGLKKSTICCLQDTHRLKVIGCKMLFKAKRNKKEVFVAILIFCKTDFKHRVPALGKCIRNIEHL